MDGQLNMEAFKDLLNFIMMEQNALVTEKSEIQDTKCHYHRELDASGQVWTHNEMPYTHEPGTLAVDKMDLTQPRKRNVPDKFE